MAQDTPTLGALIEKLNYAVAMIPGLDVNFSQPIRDNENILGPFGQTRGERPLNGIPADRCRDRRAQSR